MEEARADTGGVLDLDLTDDEAAPPDSLAVEVVVVEELCAVSGVGVSATGQMMNQRLPVWSTFCW